MWQSHYPGRREKATLTKRPRALTIGGMDAVKEQQAVDQVIERLAGRFPEFGRVEVESVVRDAVANFEGAPVRDFVPVLVERSAKNRIRQHLLGNRTA